MINRVTVTLGQVEYSALLKVANDELRNPQDQIRAILREELARRGLLKSADQRSDAQPQGGAQ